VLGGAAPPRNAVKRGSGYAFVTFDDAADLATSSADTVLALDAALEALARAHPRQALMVECRFFGGLDVQETALLLDVSESTLLRDWRAARAWLSLQLREA
jgi:DNA-directed RNA polymerase specialized sigma24 family protein